MTVYGVLALFAGMTGGTEGMMIGVFAGWAGFVAAMLILND